MNPHLLPACCAGFPSGISGIMEFKVNYNQDIYPGFHVRCRLSKQGVKSGQPGPMTC